MADKVKFELVSPEKLLLSEEVEMVVVPGTEGYFGVLAGPCPLHLDGAAGHHRLLHEQPGQRADLRLRRLRRG